MKASTPYLNLVQMGIRTASNFDFPACATLPAKSLFLRNYSDGTPRQRQPCLALARRSSIVNRFSRIHKRGKRSFKASQPIPHLGPCSVLVPCGRLPARKPYAPSKTEWHLRRAENHWRGGEPETSRRAPRFVSGCSVFRDQPFARSKVDSAPHPGANSCGRTGVKLQAESSR